MNPGTQIQAPNGYGALSKLIRYHVIYTDRKIHNRLVLVHFTAKPRKSHLSFMSIDEFEKGRHLQFVKVLRGEEGDQLPPWLRDRCGEAFEDNKDGPHSDYEVMARREQRMQLITAEFETIFTLLNPLKKLRAIAREGHTNESRLVRDALAFFAFNQDKNVLRPPKSGRGTYSRDKVTGCGKRIGRPSYAGHGSGYNVTEEMKARMQKGWRTYAKQLRGLKQVYIKTLVHVFGCSTAAEKNRSQIIHPCGLPFPTYGQFRYWIYKIFGHEQVWTSLLGSIEYRKRFPVPLGSYHEGVRDLLEKVHSDATTHSQIPKSLLSDVQSLPLIEVANYDPLSSMVVGIAWGVGSETSSLYKQASAFTALPKSLIGEVLGLEINDEDFPLYGILPTTLITDNGAGAAKKMKELNRNYGITSERTPSYNPQTNSPVERSHSKTVQVTGKPIYQVSKLTAVEMAKQSLLRIRAEMRSQDISGKLTPELIKRGIKTPLDYVKHMLAEGRIQGRPVQPNDVIRDFLPVVDFVIKDGQLTRFGVVYRSDAFSKTEFAKRIWERNGQTLTGRAFDISNRVEWVIVEKQLIKVYAVPPVQEHESHFIMGRHELPLYDKALLEAKSLAKKLQFAEAVDLEHRSIQATGYGYMDSTLNSGRAQSRKRRRAI